MTVLPFHSSLFQSVINTQVPCIPVAISYQSVKTKKISTAPAFIGEMSLLQSIQSTLRESPLVVRLDIGEPLVGMSDRKVLSDKAREVILLLRGANNSAPK
jgi:1-acyl-sn-glycerol-3-phosphate acyltransferase